MEFGVRLAKTWPSMRYWHLARWNIENAVGDRGGANDPLAGIYASNGRYGRSTSFRIAYELRAELLGADCRSQTIAARAAPYVESLGDAVAALAIHSRLAEEAIRLWERTLRCRNALMHGGSVSNAAVLTTRPFLRYLTDTALSLTLRGLENPTDTFGELAATEKLDLAELDRLHSGISHYAHWVSSTQALT